ncbi:10083_t:CDS:1, partial [Dentiscutata heterogama]
DKELSYKLFKEVADNVEEYQDTISEAPYQYAISLLDDTNKGVENRMEL